MTFKRYGITQNSRRAGEKKNSKVKNHPCGWFFVLLINLNDLVEKL